MSAITTTASAVMPPAPRPCTTRKAMSISADCDSPARAEPATKMIRDSCTSSLRSNRSASLPQIGVLAVIDSSVEVITQV